MTENTCEMDSSKREVRNAARNLLEKYGCIGSPANIEEILKREGYRIEYTQKYSDGPNIVQYYPQTKTFEVDKFLDIHFEGRARFALCKAFYRVLMNPKSSHQVWFNGDLDPTSSTGAVSIDLLCENIFAMSFLLHDELFNNRLNLEALMKKKSSEVLQRYSGGFYDLCLNFGVHDDALALKVFLLGGITKEKFFDPAGLPFAPEFRERWDLNLYRVDDDFESEVAYNYNDC